MAASHIFPRLSKLPSRHEYYQGRLRLHVRQTRGFICMQLEKPGSQRNSEVSVARVSLFSIGVAFLRARVRHANLCRNVTHTLELYTSNRADAISRPAKDGEFADSNSPVSRPRLLLQFPATPLSRGHASHLEA
jgi:hypothetical protein